MCNGNIVPMSPPKESTREWDSDRQDNYRNLDIKTNVSIKHWLAFKLAIKRPKQ